MGLVGIYMFVSGINAILHDMTYGAHISISSKHLQYSFQTHSFRYTQHSNCHANSHMHDLLQTATVHQQHPMESPYFSKLICRMNDNNRYPTLQANEEEDHLSPCSLRPNSICKYIKTYVS